MTGRLWPRSTSTEESTLRARPGWASSTVHGSRSPIEASRSSWKHCPGPLISSRLKSTLGSSGYLNPSCLSNTVTLAPQVTPDWWLHS